MRTTLLSLAGLGAAGWLSAPLIAGGQGATKHDGLASNADGRSGIMMTKDQKIATR